MSRSLSAFDKAAAPINPAAPRPNPLKPRPLDEGLNPLDALDICALYELGIPLEPGVGRVTFPPAAIPDLGLLTTGDLVPVSFTLEFYHDPIELELIISATSSLLNL